MIISKPELLTKLEIWSPRYHDKADGAGEWVALLATYRVDNSSPVILIEFTKAKHLYGQRFCITRQNAQRCPIDSNGSIPCYAVPMSMLDGWDSAREVLDLIDTLAFDGTEAPL